MYGDMIKHINVVLTIILLLVPFSNVFSVSSHMIETNEDMSEDINLWAVIITVGNTDLDDRNSEDLNNLLLDNGWNKDNIYKLRENEATKKAILSISYLLNENGLKNEDIVLFYFSMHGGRFNDVNPIDEPDGLDEFIIPFRENENEDKILDDELNLMFEKINSENIVIIFETCYSGGMIDGTKDLKKSGRIIMTSTKEDETSYGFFLKESWVFPYYLMKALRGKADKNFDSFISAEEAFEFAKVKTIRRTTIYGYLLFVFHKSLFIQHPQIYDGWPSEENNTEELILVSID